MKITKYPILLFVKSMAHILAGSIISYQAIASNDISAKIIGSMDVQFGYYDHANNDNSVSPNRDNIAFNSTGSVAVIAQNQLDSGAKYGAQIALHTLKRMSRNTSSLLFVESEGGRWEFGSGKSAYSIMRISGYNRACATAGGWDTWFRTNSAEKAAGYVTNFGNFLDPKLRRNDNIEYSKKITYYSPELSNFQLGVSYIPDTSNVGSNAISDPVFHDPLKTKTYKIDIKNAVAAALSYKYSFSDDIALRASVAFEKGKPVQQPIDAITPPIKWKKLKTYTIGAELAYKNLVFSGSYMNYMRSITSPDIDSLGRDTSVIGSTIRYDRNPKLSYSISHLRSKSKASTLNATTIATEYKIASGILPYAEFTYCSTGGKHVANGVVINNTNLKAKLFIIGTKFIL